MYRMRIASDAPLTQQVLQWEEWDSQLEPNNSRICILTDDYLRAFQVGSRALGTPPTELVEKGTVQWNVFKTAKLSSLQGKLLDESCLKPKNPKRTRIQHTLSTLSKMPKSYTIQTPKEQRTVEYVNRFQDEFFRLYRHRRPPLLIPENECGVRKLICSSIRPTKTHYTELYDLAGISRFVSDFIHFEPLEDPLHPPQYVVSPTSTLKWQAGDAFDISVLLASLLIGVGYDAYVCIGYAPRSVVLNDQSGVQYGYKCWKDLAASTVESDGKEDQTTSALAEDAKYRPRVFCSLPQMTEKVQTTYTLQALQSLVCVAE